MSKEFKRRDWHKYKRLGKKIKSKRKWRRPRGRHNKMRENKRGYQASPTIGRRTGINEGKLIIRIRNENDLITTGKRDNIIFDRRIGKKKRIMLLEKANSLGIKILDFRDKGGKEIDKK